MTTQAKCSCTYEWRPLEGFHATTNGYAVDWIRSLPTKGCRVHGHPGIPKSTEKIGAKSE